jgi:putative ABC transport system permease protein
MDSLLQDLRYALRGLRNQPGFAALAVLTLALGIGATTTMYSVIYNVLIDPFPYKGADRVVQVQIRDAERANSGGRSYFQTPEFLDYQQQNHVFEEIIAGGGEDILYTTTDGTEQLDGALVSENLFTFLGLPAEIGRTLVPDDAKPGAAPVFVMGYKMWAKYFSLDPAVVGRVFTFNGIPTTCVGVMPRRFTKLNADVYKLVVLDRGNPQLAEQYFMFQGRLKPGVTLQQAEADMDVLARQLAKVYPRNYPAKFIVRVVSWVENIVGQFRKTLYTLAAAVALLLLIACGNVANMLLARATVREKEMAIRASLGAGRGRLIRQMLAESFLLALLGAAVGCVFAHYGVKTLAAAIPDGAIPKEAVIQLNVPVLLLSLATAALTAFVFGLIPALQTVRQDLVEPLKDGGKGASGGGRRGKLRRALVVVEVALSFMLLAGAGLLIRSFMQLQNIDLGFNPDKILFVRLPLPRGRYDTAADKQRYFSQVLTRLQSLPGVTSVTAATSLPPYGGIRSEIDIPGKTHTERWDSLLSLCSEGYAQTLGLRLIRGRFLNEAEVNSSRKVAVVNQEFAKRFFGTEDPIGRQVTFKVLTPPPAPAPAAGTPGTPAPATPAPAAETPVFEIIGVVSNTKNQGPQDATIPETFVPYAVTGRWERAVMLRTETEPLSLIQTVRREIWAQDRSVAVSMTDSLSNFLRNFTYSTPRFSLLVLGVFAGVGLILVALGVYSVIAYTVSRQTHEIGVRMALGATRADVLRLVLWTGLQLVVLGVLVGLAVSLLTTRVLTLTNQLWNVSPHDPLTYSIVIAVVALSGAAACYIPARRATRVDPMVALRRE